MTKRYFRSQISFNKFTDKFVSFYFELNLRNDLNLSMVSNSGNGKFMSSSRPSQSLRLKLLLKNRKQISRMSEHQQVVPAGATGAAPTSRDPTVEQWYEYKGRAMALYAQDVPEAQILEQTLRAHSLVIRNLRQVWRQQHPNEEYPDEEKLADQRSIQNVGREIQDLFHVIHWTEDLARRRAEPESDPNNNVNVNLTFHIEEPIAGPNMNYSLESPMNTGAADGPRSPARSPARAGPSSPVRASTPIRGAGEARGPVAIVNFNISPVRREPDGRNRFNRTPPSPMVEYSVGSDRLEASQMDPEFADEYTLRSAIDPRDIPDEYSYGNNSGDETVPVTEEQRRQWAAAVPQDETMWMFLEPAVRDRLRRERDADRERNRANEAAGRRHPELPQLPEGDRRGDETQPIIRPEDNQQEQQQAAEESSSEEEEN